MAYLFSKKQRATSLLNEVDDLSSGSTGIWRFKGVQTRGVRVSVPGKMYPPVVTKDPTAVAVEVQSAYLAILPHGDAGFVSQVFGWATDCFTGRFQDYLAVDAAYHDFEHTLQGTLCMARLLRGWHLAGTQPLLTQEIVELGLIAILLHDTGYLKRRGDTEGTGAKYTINHVQRSCDFAARLLTSKGFNIDRIRSVQNMIQCTEPEAVMESIPFSGELERTAGYAVGTSDLLGQMAADDYVEKLPMLYREFAEAAAHSEDATALRFLGTYSSAEDLMRKTPAFWDNVVKARLTDDFGGVYRHLNDPHPHGPNPYVVRIEANVERLRNLFRG